MADTLDPDFGNKRNELEREEWLLLATMDMWNCEMRDDIQIHSPRCVLSRLPKMKIPENVRWKTKYVRKLVKLQTFIELQFITLHHILSLASEAMEAIYKNQTFIVEKLKNVNSKNNES